MNKNGKRTKFNVTKNIDKRTYKGVVYDSELEMKFYRDYVEPKMGSGEIVKCEAQVPYTLQEQFSRIDSNGKKITVRAINYVADFVITWSNGLQEVIDTKGMPDSVAKLKRKMFWYKFPETKYSWISYSKVDGGWIEYEDLKRARALRKKSKSIKK